MRDVILTNPKFSKTFVIHRDDSDYQLRAVIAQEGKQIAFFCRKLNKDQRNYTTTEKELLSIVETLKEFRNILLRYLMRWRFILEEYGLEMHYILEPENIVADAISRIPMINDEIKVK